MRSLIALAALLAVAGCAYPQSQTEQGQKSGLLYFPGSPATAHVLIDGVDAGLAGAFSGKTMLAVPPGAHRVSVRSGVDVFIDKTFYVDAGAEVAIQ